MINAQDIQDYGKAVYANKVTLLGIAIAGTSLLFESDNEITQQFIENFALNGGAMLIGATKGGLGTFSALRRTRAHLQQHGTLDERMQKINGRYYCDATGVMAALEEQGMSDIAGERLRETATLKDAAKKWGRLTLGMTSAYAAITYLLSHY